MRLKGSLSLKLSVRGWVICLLVSATLVSLLPLSLGAECIDTKVTTRQAFELSSLVFSGTVTNVEDPNAPGLTQMLTFIVDQVWKGPAAKQQVIYHSLSAESRVFGRAEKLVVFARELPVLIVCALVCRTKVSPRMGTCPLVVAQECRSMSTPN